jgi:hypothetical protein
MRETSQATSETDEGQIDLKIPGRRRHQMLLIRKFCPQNSVRRPFVRKIFFAVRKNLPQLFRRRRPTIPPSCKVIRKFYPQILLVYFATARGYLSSFLPRLLVRGTGTR